jgi:DHA1 family multidrug resistance protein-like MFS transporter
MGLARNVYELLALSIVYGLFSGFTPSAIALIATNVPEDRLGFALGWMSTAQLAGTLIGPLVGGLLADGLHSYREVFFCSSAAGLAGATITFLSVREHTRPRPLDAPRSGGLGAAFGEIVRHPQLAPMFVVLLLAQASALAVQPIVAPFVHTLVPGSAWVATFAGLAVAVTGIADLMASPFLGKRSDRIGYRRVLMISIAGAACFTVPQAFAHSIWTFLALRFGVGVFLGGILPTANAWIGRLFPPHQRGRVYGVTSSATFLGMFAGPLIGGAVATQLGFPVVFELVGALMLCNLVWIAVGTRASALAAENAA